MLLQKRKNIYILMEVMKMEKILNELITKKAFDKRLIPYIKEFFRYNAEQFGWNEETIARRAALLKQKLVGMEFIELKEGLVATDFELKNILIDSSIIGKKISQEELIELFYEIFRELEMLTNKNGAEFYTKMGSTYALETLKYKRNSTIIQFISNAFNIDGRDVHRIKEIFEQQSNDNSNKERENYVESCITVFLPNISMAVKRIMSDDNSVDKKHEYITLYATAINVIRLRLEDQEEDKGRLKSQYDEINRLFSDIIDEYCIMGDQLQGEHIIDSTCSCDIYKIQRKIEECLKDVEPKKIDSGTKVKRLEEYLYLRDLQDARKITEEETLEGEYIQEQTMKATYGYEERFRPIIQEYFKRSAQIYKWSRGEFDKKIKNFLLRVKKIEFKRKVDPKDIAIEGRAEQNKVQLSDDRFMKSRKTEIGIMFHEFEHETDKSYRNRCGLENSTIQYHNICEYATEIGAMHLLGDSVYEDKLCFTHKMNGYEDFRYAGSMMAAALGISEFEFARLRDKGNREFLKYFEERYSYIDIKGALTEFEEILHDILDAPKIIYMRQLSEAYGRMYNLANGIIISRLAHEKSTILPEKQDEFEVKTRYEKSKIAINMRLAKKRLHLREKYMRPIIEDDSMIVDYSRITRKEKEQYLELIERIYPEKNVRFDNRDLFRHLDREIRHPIIGKIARVLEKNNVPKLNGPVATEIKERPDRYKDFRDSVSGKLRCTFGKKNKLPQETLKIEPAMHETNKDEDNQIE